MKAISNLADLVLGSASELESLNNVREEYPIDGLFKGIIHRSIKVSQIPISNIFDIVEFVPRPEGYTVNQYCIISTLAKNLDDLRLADDIEGMKKAVEDLQKYGNVVSLVNPKRIYKSGFALTDFGKRIVKDVPWTEKYLPNLKSAKKYFGFIGKIKEYFLKDESSTYSNQSEMPIAIARTRNSIKFPGGLYINPDLEYDFNQRLLQIQREQQNSCG